MEETVVIAQRNGGKLAVCHFMTHVANRVNTGEKANHTKNGEEQTAQTINMKPQSRSEYFSCISGSLDHPECQNQQQCDPKLCNTVTVQVAESPRFRQAKQSSEKAAA